MIVEGGAVEDLLTFGTLDALFVKRFPVPGHELFCREHRFLAGGAQGSWFGGGPRHVAVTVEMFTPSRLD